MDLGNTLKQRMKLRTSALLLGITKNYSMQQARTGDREIIRIVTIFPSPVGAWERLLTAAVSLSR